MRYSPGSTGIVSRLVSPFGTTSSRAPTISRSRLLRRSGLPPLPYTVHAYEDTEYTEFTDECGARTLSLNDPEISDPLYACQWQLNSPGGGHINAEDAWSEGITGDGVNVAIVDDGMYFTHVDLRDNVDTSRNHDYTGSRQHIHAPGTPRDACCRHHRGAGQRHRRARAWLPRATVYGYNYLAGETTALKAVDAMGRNRVRQLRCPTTAGGLPTTLGWASPALSGSRR